MWEFDKVDNRIDWDNVFILFLLAQFKQKYDQD